MANIVPLFKKGDRANPANYRPVSLTSICCKILEHVLHSTIINHLESQKILCENQHGFRKSRSCESQLILTVDDLARNMDDGCQTDAILLDFSKAFDKVCHRLLIHKLDHYGIRGNNLMWIKDFLSNRLQNVVLEGDKSREASVTSGVPQGTVLGPLLFLAYINDLPDCVSSTTRMFADDCLVYRRINSIEDSKALQSDLDNLQQWENEWLMEFNASKCEAIRITNKRNPTDTAYTIHNTPLARVSSAKYLGLNIHEKLSWSHHINTITKRANQSLNFLKRNLYSCPPKVKEQCYKTLVRPQLEYASSVWDPHTKKDSNKIEAVQNRAARFTLRDYGRTSSVTNMKSQLGWPTLHQRRCQSKVVMIYKIRNGLIAIPAEPYLVAVTRETRGYQTKYIHLAYRLNVYGYSFFPSAVRLWNTVPPDIAMLPTLDAFKGGITAVPF